MRDIVLSMFYIRCWHVVFCDIFNDIAPYRKYYVIKPLSKYPSTTGTRSFIQLQWQDVYMGSPCNGRQAAMPHTQILWVDSIVTTCSQILGTSRESNHVWIQSYLEGEQISWRIPICQIIFVKQSISQQILKSFSTVTWPMSIRCNAWLRV